MSEEQKPIKKLEKITNDYTLNSEDLHYAIVLYHLIINLQQENKDMNRTIELFSKSLYNADLKRYENILKELRSWLEEQVFNRGGSSIDISIELHAFCKVLDKLNELEGNND